MCLWSKHTVLHVSMVEAGGQGVLYKAKKHKSFVKVSFPLPLDRCVGPNVDKSSTSLSHPGPKRRHL